MPEVRRECDYETALAHIALSAASATQLHIASFALAHKCAEYQQTACRYSFVLLRFVSAAQLYVHTSSRWSWL